MLRINIVAVAVAASLCGAVAVKAQPTAASTCEKAALSKLDFLTCEGARLRDKGQKLLRQANLQIAQGQGIVADCERLEDEAAGRDCNLLSSDLIEDAAFKQAEAADILNEAARMDARAADMRRAKR
ncbi:MAG: hypothetical protein Q7N95_08840 [Alphaproteobacteria bacterium]|nr:hypothetical protein [Alphaproteobacteria bacterium]